jgi:hypothetical protein
MEETTELESVDEIYNDPQELYVIHFCLRNSVLSFVIENI